MLLWRGTEEEDEVSGALKPVDHVSCEVPLPVVINLPVRPPHSKCFRQVDSFWKSLLNRSFLFSFLRMEFEAIL